MINKKGFTLVELLVVIAIIALLLAILMPSLQQAREQAKKVICGSNLRQHGTAINIFANDKGKYPHRVDMASWPMSYGYRPEQGQATPDNIAPAGPGAFFDEGYLQMAKKHFNFLYCPAAKGELTYNDVFKRTQMNDGPNGTVYNPNWPVELNYITIQGGFAYWVDYPKDYWIDDKIYSDGRIRLAKLVVIKMGDKSNKVIMSDLIRTNEQGVDLGKHTNHTGRKGVLGGNTMYNDLSVKWLHFDKMYENPSSTANFETTNKHHYNFTSNPGKGWYWF